jgi:hypothetical protein
VFDTGTLVPIAFFITIAFILVGVTTIISDGRTRRLLIKSGAAPELARAIGAAPKDDPGLYGALKWGIVTGAVILIQFLPYRSDEPIVLGVILVFLAAGLLAYYVTARRLERPTGKAALVLCALVLGTAPLAAQQEIKPVAVIRFEGALLSSPGLVSRMTGGVGAAFGAPIGSRFILSAEVVHHAFRRYDTDDYEAGVHTDLTLQGEYALTSDGPYHTQVLALLGLGAQFRNPYRAVGEMLGGVGFWYALTPTIGFRGAVEDRVTFIPQQQLACPAGQYCYGYGVRHDTRHTPSALVSLELRL